MKKIILISLLINSLFANSQISSYTIGVGIGNQYSLLGGARLGMLNTKKIESSLSFGYTGFGFETTLGLTYYFKGYDNHVDLLDDKFEWPSGIAFGANYYRSTKKAVENSSWLRNDFGASLLIIYKLKPCKGYFKCNTRRFGFGVTYMVGQQTKLIILPSLMFGVDFKIKTKQR
jgi:hypothetical protein